MKVRKPRRPKPRALPRQYREPHDYEPNYNEPPREHEADGQPVYDCTCHMPRDSRRHTHIAGTTTLPPRPDGARPDAILGEHDDQGDDN